MEEEIKYLNYGSDQIELLALLTSLANEVPSYVQLQPWSKKKKERFMAAYSDILSKGIIGASNTSGQWTIDVGDNIDFDSMNKKDKEMYSEAAYFILQQMSAIPTKIKKEEEKKKDLPVFNNTFFMSDFVNHISNQQGGREFNIGGDKDDWNYLDERDSITGLRGRSNRAARLANYLESYANSLEEGKYNFENSPFKDLKDLKTRISNAVVALRTPEASDDRDALNSIGIRDSDWFNNGSGDPSDKVDSEGNPLTWGQVGQLLLMLADQEALAVAILLQEEEKSRYGVLNLVDGIHGHEARTNSKAYLEYIASQFGTGELGFNAMNSELQNLIEGAYRNLLSEKDKHRLGNLLYYVRNNNPHYLKSNLSDNEWSELRLHTKILKSLNREGYVRLPWQTSDGRYTYADDKGNIYFLKPKDHKKFEAPKFLKSAAYDNYKKNFLGNTSTGIDDKLQQYLKSIGFTESDMWELGGIVADIASIVDPEPISAGALGVGAAGARNRARYLQPKDWSFSDYFWLGVDYLTGAAGALPLVGDAILASKTAKTVARWAKRVMTIPAVMETLLESPGALVAVNKTIKGEDLTVEDWKHLGSFMRGLTATHNITASNRASRRALEKRGYDLSDLQGILKRTGLWDTRTPTTQATVKVNVKGTEKEIPISSKSKLKLDKELKKAGNNLTKRNVAIRKVEEVKEHVNNEKLKPEDITAIESSHLRNSRFIPRLFATTEGNFGRIETETRPNPDTFEAYLNSNRSLWDRIKYGSNRNLRRYDPGEALLSVQGSQVGNLNVSSDNLREILHKKAIARRYRDVLNGKFSDEPVLEGTFEIDGITYKVSRNKKGRFTLTDDRPISKSTPQRIFSNLKEITLKKKMAELVILSRKQLNSSGNKKTTEEIGEILQGLKRKGWLKQGGKIIITDAQIDNFLNLYK